MFRNDNLVYRSRLWEISDPLVSLLFMTKRVVVINKLLSVIGETDTIHSNVFGKEMNHRKWNQIYFIFNPIHIFVRNSWRQALKSDNEIEIKLPEVSRRYQGELLSASFSTVLYQVNVNRFGAHEHSNFSMQLPPCVVDGRATLTEAAFPISL